MHDGVAPRALVWIDRRQAINPAMIVSVFHAKNGEVQITLVTGDPIKVLDHDLTEEGQELLLPKATSPHQMPGPELASVS